MAEDLSNYIKKTDYATKDTVGVVKVDGNTIDVDGLGQLKVHNLKQFYPVIATYVSGTSGYRIWADGYCEQWGYMSNTGHGSAYEGTITFAKPFKDTNYCFMRTVHKNGIGNDPGTRWISGYNAKSTNKITYFTDQVGYIAGDQWKASGYLAEGQY